MSPGLLRTLHAFGRARATGTKPRTLMRSSGPTRIGRRTHSARRSKVNNRPALRRVTTRKKLF